LEQVFAACERVRFCFWSPLQFSECCIGWVLGSL
jgi:hypothetical protein